MCRVRLAGVPCQSHAVRAVDGNAGNGANPTIVLVHGSGHTARVWGGVQTRLRHGSVAVDLPGRADRVADIADVTLDAAARSLAADVDAGSTVRSCSWVTPRAASCCPALAARLGERVAAPRVRRRPLRPPRRDGDAHGAARCRSRSSPLGSPRCATSTAGCMLDPDPSVEGVRAIDAKTAAPLDSLNYMEQMVSWDGVPTSLPRTFVRCVRDRIQPRVLQDALIDELRRDRRDRSRVGPHARGRGAGRARRDP